MYLCSLICGQGGALAAGEALRLGQADVDATEVACHGLQPPLWGVNGVSCHARQPLRKWRVWESDTTGEWA